MAHDILIVDDEADIRGLIAGILDDEGYETRQAANSTEALSQIAQRRPSLIILDIWLQNSKMDGLDLLETIKERHASLPVIIISGHGTIETAVTALKRGAYDFIEKPFQSEHLLLCVRRACETERLRRENEELRERSGLEIDLSGHSASIANTRATLRRVAGTGSRVLISGPAGAGKEIAARLLHQWSPRQSAAFLVLSARARLSKQACSNKHMAAHYSLMKWRICRYPRKARFYGC
jgi:two-component system, NtrC family, nitrogen regulation response regulator NtrX